MRLWFKTKYSVVERYSPNWYGIHDYAPNATILLYDDNIGECIGYIDDSSIHSLKSLRQESVTNIKLPDYVVELTEKEALEIINNYKDVDGVWFGDKLAKRWELKESDMIIDDSGTWRSKEEFYG